MPCCNEMQARQYETIFANLIAKQRAERTEKGLEPAVHLEIKDVLITMGWNVRVIPGQKYKQDDMFPDVRCMVGESAYYFNGMVYSKNEKDVPYGTVRKGDKIWFGFRTREEILTQTPLFFKELGTAGMVYLYENYEDGVFVTNDYNKHFFDCNDYAIVKADLELDNGSVGCTGCWGSLTYTRREDLYDTIRKFIEKSENAIHERNNLPPTPDGNDADGLLKSDLRIYRVRKDIELFPYADTKYPLFYRR